jgi:hypothetical protein
VKKKGLRINEEKVKELETKESRTPGKSLTFILSSGRRYRRREDCQKIRLH